jgi:hexokinase
MSSQLSEAQTVALNTVLDRFRVSGETLKKISEQFVKEMEKGLDHEGATSEYCRQKKQETRAKSR